MLLPFLLSLLTLCCSSYKILVYNPKAAYSHMNFMGKIADTLVDAGHEVVTLQPVILQSEWNGTKKSRIIHVEMDRRVLEGLIGDRKESSEMWTASVASLSSFVGNILFLKALTTATVTRLLDNKDLLEQLKSEDFDVGIAELFDFAGIPVFQAIGLENIVGAHSLGSLPEGTAYSIGVPVIPSFMPASQGISDDSTSFSNRALNLLYTYMSRYFQTSIASAAEAVMVEKLGKNATPIWDVVSNMTWILTNTEPFLEFAKPTLHKVVDIGGIGVPEPKPLEKKWDRILSIRPHTVLISFGSMVTSKAMPYEYKRAIIKLVKSFPDITFIWKYEEPEEAPFAAGVENLFLSKWMPQNDLLADERLSLFITHCGAGSLLESATRGKPLIAIPLYGDQMRNANLAVKFGFGIIVNKENLKDSAVMHDAIEKIIGDEKYLKAARRIRNILARRPFPPEEKLVKTVELAAEFGSIPELYVAGRNLNFIVYHNIDLFLILFIVCSLVIFTILYCVTKVLRALRKKDKAKTQ
ncbi:UDP-glucoronosyl and UDP-glucosyl transferase [Oesophagostomum dentatum]|uniref:UDP-glucuronosyltransferase n=1 Tax=Oesophagostomum dentatum TaxID=61180 RepID=A0A0B1T1M2_OESDE|nr:UDP-glucoronosyl and UDP-glucosyl transferase [Oesophagostomum dentatum]